VNDRYQIHTLDPSERTDEILELLSSTMPQGASNRYDESYWNWKHVINPAGRSLVHVATDSNDKIVSTRSFIRWRFARGDEVIEGFRAADSATIPEHQRKGLFTRTTTRAVEEAATSSAALVLGNPITTSLPGYRNVGFKVIGMARSKIKASARIKLRNIGRTSTTVAPALLRGRRPSGASVAPKFAATQESATQFASDARTLRSGSRLLRTDPTPEFVHWRFGLDPRFEHGLYVSRSAGKPDWAIAYRMVQQVFGYRIGTIDQVEPANLSQKQLAEIADFMSSVESVDEIRILTLDDRDSSVFSEGGFSVSSTSHAVTCFPLKNEFAEYAGGSDLWSLQNADINGI
jgi:hypothetical protein